MDYYKILGLETPSSVTLEDVSKAFRKLSMVHHPMKHQNTLAASQKEFNKICEAYDVLSSQEHKAVYDKYGEVGLKNGIPSKKEKGKTVGGYCFKGNTLEIFERFFGSTNPYTEFYVTRGKPEVPKEKHPNKPEEIIVTLSCSIHEFYNGSLKSFSYQRDRLQPDGRTSEKEDIDMTVEIRPGYDVNTVLIYPSKGNEIYAMLQGELQIKFEIDDNVANNYKRKGDDLYLAIDMTLEEALLSRPVCFQTLDGRSININLDKMITPQTVHKIEGEGMPKKANNHQKGDLFISFNIQFPKNFNVQYKNEIVKLLQQCK